MQKQSCVLQICAQTSTVIMVAVSYKTARLPVTVKRGLKEIIVIYVSYSLHATLLRATGVYNLLLLP